MIERLGNLGLQEEGEVDVNNLNFQNVISIANGSIPHEVLREQVAQQQGAKKVKEIHITSDDNNSKKESVAKIDNVDELMNQSLEKEYSTKYV